MWASTRFTGICVMIESISSRLGRRQSVKPHTAASLAAAGNGPIASSSVYLLFIVWGVSICQTIPVLSSRVQAQSFGPVPSAADSGSTPPRLLILV